MALQLGGDGEELAARCASLNLKCLRCASRKGKGVVNRHHLISSSPQGGGDALFVNRIVYDVDVAVSSGNHDCLRGRRKGLSHGLSA